jgi:hypothetical protein
MYFKCSNFQSQLAPFKDRLCFLYSENVFFFLPKMVESNTNGTIRNFQALAVKMLSPTFGLNHSNPLMILLSCLHWKRFYCI